MKNRSAPARKTGRASVRWLATGLALAVLAVSFAGLAAPSDMTAADGPQSGPAATTLDGSMGSREQNLVARNRALSARLQEIRETSADAIRIAKENETYRRRLIQLRSTVDRLKHENEALQARRAGMQIGALILLGGILIGLILPKLRRRRANNWDAL